MNSPSNPKVVAELRRLAKKNGGLLQPEVVLDSARFERSPLHNYFCWDDDEAAHNYRVWQARVLIRTTVKLIKIKGEKRFVRVFVSLTPDRYSDGGGYRDVVSVLSKSEMKQQMLQDAFQEMECFETKYSHLEELTRLFLVTDELRKELL